MTDSDDDWFEKDIDTFVIEKKNDKKKEEPTELDEEWLNNQASDRRIPDDFFDPDYGGNYKITSSQNKTKSKTKHSNSDSQYIQTVSLKRLIHTSEQTTLNTFLELSQIYSEFFQTVSDINIQNDTIEATLKIIASICELPLLENVRNFVKQIFENKIYFDKIAQNTKRVLQEIPKFKKKIVFEINLEEYLKNLFVLCKTITLNLIINDNFIKFVGNIHDMLVTSKHTEITSKFAKLRLEVEAIAVSKVSCDIYPSLDDLKDNSLTILKPNIIEGKYPNVEHYLDVQLSLLREDFILPLRDGISQFISESENENKTKNFNIRTYPNVRILIKEHEFKGRKIEQLVVDLDPKKLEKLSDNTNTKKFMFGSLLCFSSTDQFNDLSLAVVSNRDLDLLNNGFIQIELIYIDPNLANIFDKDFILVESEVYFEPYHQVFKVLKNLDSHNFPLQKYLIDCENANEMPGYVSDAAKIYYKHMKYVFSLKEINSWPPPAALNLNQSQFEALHAALTRKFCIIQGPPGTGKTYIGLQIVSALLENTDSQILIICYTNHALDQFLNGILKYSDDIVRLGNQSKNEKLDQFNIKQISDSSYDKRIKAWYYLTKQEYQNLLQKFEKLQKKIASAEPEDQNNISIEILKVQTEMRAIGAINSELKQVAEFNLIKDKRIIAMTTTCAARSHTLLQLLKTPIVIIEEAAEILESHIVAALTKDTQHVVLIGDHQQLRPTTSVYRLAKHYNMDISLFERMINNNINCCKLSTQHRMKPEFANLIRPHIYKELIDGDDVIDLPEIHGVVKSLFFFTHANHESKLEDETTKKNIFEAQFAIGLCNYLLQQGYKQDDITILTTYNGQLFQLFNERKKNPSLQNVRITVVDNYQGEENKIIILSLVRSNTDNNIGYLAMKNRICVALSRAQEGLFIIGNMTMLAQNNQTWKSIEDELIKQNSISEEFPLQCKTHGQITKIHQPSDFKQMSQLGGCTNICNFTMDCGHNCKSICHTEMYKHSTDCSCDVQKEHKKK